MSNFWQTFDDAAGRFAGNTAIEIQRSSGLERVTYHDLKTWAEGVAAWCVGAGIAHGDRCAILADNDARWCAVYLGLLRIGAIAVPLDTNYSSSQVATIMRASGARLIVCGTRLLPVADAAALDVPVVHMYRGDGDARPSVDDMLRAKVGPQPEWGLTPTAADPAVILYTSGTTSDPKGVVLTHGNLAAERESAFAVVDVDERDAVLGVLPLFHSLAQMANLLLPFAVGARVVYLETLNTTDLLKALAERRITIFACVPQFFYLIHQRVMGEVARGGWLKQRVFKGLLGLNLRLRGLGVNIGPKVFGRVHKVLGGHMRLLITGGSKFDPAIGRDLYALGFTIQQAYGLTETSGAATLNRPDEAHIDTVGRILPGNELKVLPPEGDADDGEIAIRGPIVMQGYYHRPDANAEVFRDGWFLTGDLGRIDSDGRLTITGRKKEIIVLASGKNIYPEEIEAQYRKSAVIREICVMGVVRPDEPTTERLHAVVVLDDDVLKARKVANAGDLLRFEMESAGAALPSHKRVLGYDVWFEPLPRTTTGKLKRFQIQRTLQEREAARVVEAARPLGAADQEWLDDPHVAEAATLVRQRAKGDATLRPEANLELDLGLDSMERVELLTELEQRFAVKVPEGAMHEIATVRQLVEAVRPEVGVERRRGGCRVVDAAGRHPAGDRSGVRPAARTASRDDAAAVAGGAGAGPGAGTRARGGPRPSAGEGAVPHLSEPPGLLRSVPALQRAAVSRVPRHVRGGRGRVLPDAAHAVAGASGQPRARRSRLGAGAGDEGRRLRALARAGAAALPRGRTVHRRHGEALQEGGADSRRTRRRADRTGGAQRHLGDVAAHQGHRLALRGRVAEPPRPHQRRATPHGARGRVLRRRRDATARGRGRHVAAALTPR